MLFSQRKTKQLITYTTEIYFWKAMFTKPQKWKSGLSKNLLLLLLTEKDIQLLKQKTNTKITNLLTEGNFQVFPLFCPSSAKPPAKSKLKATKGKS